MPRQAATARDAPKANKARPAQSRSRQTRRKIVKSAVQLWMGRGFDQSFDTTTVDEIADNAGVSRATVYYYFPKKEDILRELAWVTADDIYECALRSMMNGQPVNSVLDDIMGKLGAKVTRSSPAVVKRMLQLRHNDAETINRETLGGLTRTFSVALTHAQEMGELPKQLSAMEIAEVIASAAMGCISKWSIMGDEFDLVARLRSRAMLVLTGARNLA